MSLIEAAELIKIFKKLNESGLSYILLRNINHELPDKLKVGKDIDLLVHKHEEDEFKAFFKSNCYNTIKHPFRNEIFLYGVDKFEFKYNNNNKILFDLNFQLAVRSLDAGQWIPLDQEIQDSAWNNVRFEKNNSGLGYWTLSCEDELVSLVSRSIFDKKSFEEGYIHRIEELMPLVNLSEIEYKFRLIFFKFAPHLVSLISNKQFQKILYNYLRFIGY
jgi:hypothetical protein